MTIHSFLIYDRHCNCIYSREFPHSSTTKPPGVPQLPPSASSASIMNSSLPSAPVSTGTGTRTATDINSKRTGSVNQNNDANNSKLLFGVLHSLKLIASNLTKNNASEKGDAEEMEILARRNELKQFTLGQYKIHFWESLTRFKFILISDVAVNELQTVLEQLYSIFFLKYVVENPLSPIEFKWNEDTSTKNSNTVASAGTAPNRSSVLRENEFSGMINNLKFIEETDKYLQSLPMF